MLQLRVLCCRCSLVVAAAPVVGGAPVGAPVVAAAPIAVPVAASVVASVAAPVADPFAAPVAASPFSGAVDLRYPWLTGNVLSPWPAPNPR